MEVKTKKVVLHLTIQDSNGEFTIPSEYIGITGISPASVRKKAVDGEDDVEVSG